jgi:hypothetical protein
VVQIYVSYSSPWPLQEYLVQLLTFQETITIITTCIHNRFGSLHLTSCGVAVINVEAVENLWLGLKLLLTQANINSIFITDFTHSTESLDSTVYFYWQDTIAHRCVVRLYNVMNIARSEVLTIVTMNNTVWDIMLCSLGGVHWYSSKTLSNV